MTEAAYPELGSPAIGVVGLPGKWSTDHLAETVRRETGGCLTIDLASVDLDLASATCRYHDFDLTRLDAILVKKIDEAYSPQNMDRIEALHFLQAKGVAMFSRPERIARLINRLSCTVELRAANIPMPDTRITEDPARATDSILEFGGAVLKPLFSTKARGMRLIESSDPAEVRRIVDEFQAEGNRTIYIQRKVAMPDRDLGIVFIGREYLTTYARVRQDDAWSTTTENGGTYADHPVDDQTIALAKKVRDLFELDFTVVDLVLTGQGPLVFEVSAFGGFRGILEGCGIDAAEPYVRHVLAHIESRKSSKH